MKVLIDIPEIPKNDKQRWALANGTPYEERPHAEWIIRRDKQGAHIYSVCSKCNVPYLDTDFPNFCPNCGADMRKEGDTNDKNFSSR